MHPGVFKKNISTQQSTWMMLEDGGSAAVVLEVGGDAAALEGGIGQHFKIAAVALGGGGGRRTGNDGVSISIVKAKGLLLQHWCQQWQGRQVRMHPMRGTYVGRNGKEVGVLRWWWQWCGCKDGAGKARVRG